MARVNFNSIIHNSIIHKAITFYKRTDCIEI